MDERIEREPFGPMNFPKSPGKLPWNALVRWRGRCIRRVAARVGAKQHRRRRREAASERARQSIAEGGVPDRIPGIEKSFLSRVRPRAYRPSLRAVSYIVHPRIFGRFSLLRPRRRAKQRDTSSSTGCLPPPPTPPPPRYTRPFSSIPLSP